MAILINANGYSPVTAQEDADLYAGLVGDGRYVLASVGNKMTAEAISSNLVRVMDGVMITHGRMLYIGAGSYDEFTIQTGSQGSTNYYIIGYHIYTDSSSDEHCETFVRQMSNATATITEASLRDGASESYVSLYRVTQSGINIASIEALFDETAGVGGKLDGSGLNSDYAGIISSHGSDTDAPSTSVIYKLYQSFQDGVTKIYNAVVSNGVTPASKALSVIVAGINAIRSGGTAAASQILTGATAYVNKELVTGSMPDNGAVSATVAPGASYTIPEGYHNGSGTVTAGSQSIKVVTVAINLNSHAARTVDIKSQLPAVYSRLTSSNFYFSSITMESTAGTAESNHNVLTPNYNPSTGILSLPVDYYKIRDSDGWQGHFYYAYNVVCIYVE